MLIYRIGIAFLSGLPFFVQAQENLVAYSDIHKNIQLNLKPYVRQMSPDEKNTVEDALAATVFTDKSKSSKTVLKPPTWTFTTGTKVDSSVYNNVLIGGDPQSGGSTDANVVIIPVTFKFHKIAKSIFFDSVSSNWKYKITKKSVAIGMASPERCLPAPNNVPIQLVRQSPLFKPVDIRFGDTLLKHSQYIDAHQRATFWKNTGKDKNGFHLNLVPKFLPPLEVDVPLNEGLSVNSNMLFGNRVCGTISQVNLKWFDNYLRKVAIPKLTAKGLVSPAKTPVFIIKNLGLAFDATHRPSLH